MSSKQREIAIKTNVDVGIPETRDAIVRGVFELHRKAHHYSIRKQRPELFEKINKGILEIPLTICKESFIIYAKAKNKTDEKIPHPNYFLAVCRRLHQDMPDKYLKTIWGKEI